MNSRNPLPDFDERAYALSQAEPPFDYKAYARKDANPKEEEPDIYPTKFKGEYGSLKPDEVIPRKNSIGGRRSRRSRRRKSRRKSKRR